MPSQNKSQKEVLGEVTFTEFIKKRLGSVSEKVYRGLASIPRLFTSRGGQEFALGEVIGEDN